MFQFPALPYPYLLDSVRYDWTLLQPGSPIRTSTGQGICAPHRSFSQLVTSFFGSQCQGIHLMPFFAWPSRSAFVALTVLLLVRSSVTYLSTLLPRSLTRLVSPPNSFAILTSSFRFSLACHTWRSCMGFRFVKKLTVNVVFLLASRLKS